METTAQLFRRMYIAFGFVLIGVIYSLVMIAIGISGHTFGIHPLLAGFGGPIVICMGLSILGL